MSFPVVVSPFLPFAPIRWWCYAVAAEKLVMDPHENFVKMTPRNRYRIAGSVNTVLLSVPVAGGRNHHSKAGDIVIASTDNWQQQHWRTLVSVYKRTPFFEHYEPSLQAVLMGNHEKLIDFSLATQNWVCKQLNISLPTEVATAFEQDYGAYVADLRTTRLIDGNLPGQAFPTYYQAFADRIGFQPNLCILDLLFAEGPATLHWLRQNGPAILTQA